MASRIANANRLYKFKIPNVIESEGAHLPESYKKFYKEWKLSTPQPVHYIPTKTQWQRNDETGEVKRMENVPIPVIYPPESHSGIWGGEGVIKGFQKRTRTKQRVPHFWVPRLIQSVVYSEILDKRFSLTMTQRTIDLIIDHYGFDNYILKNKACDLQSGLAVKMKRKLLLALYNKDLYPNNPDKANQVYNKYKHFLSEFSEEDIEWYGWTIDEALRKWESQSEVEAVPLKIQLRKDLISQLCSSALEESAHGVNSTEKNQSWLRKLKLFGKK